jgi:hypothetical protein
MPIERRWPSLGRWSRICWPWIGGNATQRLHKVGYFRELLSSNEEVNESIRPLLRLSRDTIVRLQELIDGVLVNAARGRRAQAVEHCQFAMIQIRQPKHSATVIWLDSRFAHSDGLPCRRNGTTADRLGDASIGTEYGFEVLSAIA